jgi:hypothetical protein
MCGRFTRTSSREVLAQEFGVAQFVNVDLRPRYHRQRGGEAARSDELGIRFALSNGADTRTDQRAPLRQMLREVLGRALGHHTVPDTRIVRVVQARR